jgi:predicted CopG family antitoxin
MIMGHKTITISEEAYEALAGLKQKRESFTEAILRLARKRERGTLLDYVKSLEPDEEFAEIMDEVIREREKVTLRAARL